MEIKYMLVIDTASDCTLIYLSCFIQSHVFRTCPVESQWPCMGEEKAAVFPVFHKGSAAFLDIVCKTWKNCRGWGSVEIKKMGFVLLKGIQYQCFFIVSLIEKLEISYSIYPPLLLESGFLLGYMSMRSCHTVFNKLGCYFERILPDSLLGFTLCSDRLNWHVPVNTISYWDPKILIILKICFLLALSSTGYSWEYSWEYIPENSVLLPMSSVDSLKFIWFLFPPGWFPFLHVNTHS